MLGITDITEARILVKGMTETSLRKLRQAIEEEQRNRYQEGYLGQLDKLKGLETEQAQPGPEPGPEQFSSPRFRHYDEPNEKFLKMRARVERLEFCEKASADAFIEMGKRIDQQGSLIKTLFAITEKQNINIGEQRRAHNELNGQVNGSERGKGWVREGFEIQHREIEQLQKTQHNMIKKLNPIMRPKRRK